MPIPNEHLEHFVKQRLAESEELSAQRIEVIADEGRILLRGTVQTARRKVQAQEIAARHDEVREVTNELTIEEGTIRDDEPVTNEVNRCFISEPRLTHQAIRVDGLNGTITLSGYVSTDQERKIAADIAIGVSGVREINDLLVTNPDQVLANQEHANNIWAAINKTIGLNVDSVVISIVDETARLSGTVDELWKKAEIVKIIRQFGIISVCNEIVVKEKE